jgi:hypothetical protein
MTSDGSIPGDKKVTDEAALRTVYPQVSKPVRDKAIDYLDDFALKFIALSPFFCVGNSRPDGLAAGDRTPFGIACLASVEQYQHAEMIDLVNSQFCWKPAQQGSFAGTEQAPQLCPRNRIGASKPRLVGIDRSAAW